MGLAERRIALEPRREDHEARFPAAKDAVVARGLSERLDPYPEFLANFPDERGAGLLARLDFSAGEFPKAGVADASGPPREEQLPPPVLARALDEGRHYDERGGLRSGASVRRPRIVGLRGAPRA